MPYFSTTPVDVDEYAAFYETDYARPPEKSEQQKKFDQLQAKKRKEKDTLASKRAMSADKAARPSKKSYTKADKNLFEETCLGAAEYHVTQYAKDLASKELEKAVEEDFFNLKFGKSGAHSQ